MLVHIENLVKRYGDLLALDHLSLDIEEGEIFGLLGPNGSGKTTAINCLLALLKYDKGTITIFGKDMKPDSYDIKQDIGVVMQNVAVFEQMSVYENIDYFCGLYIRDKQKRKELVEEAIAFTGLSDFRKMRPKKLSGGLLRRLNIACGIVHKPRLIIMDEPTVAVDPQSRNKILEGIVEHIALEVEVQEARPCDLRVIEPVSLDALSEFFGNLARIPMEDAGRLHGEVCRKVAELFRWRHLQDDLRQLAFRQSAFLDGIFSGLFNGPCQYVFDFQKCSSYSCAHIRHANSPAKVPEKLRGHGLLRSRYAGGSGSGRLR